MRGLLALLALAVGPVSAQLLTPVWVELGEQGAIARVIVASGTACPAIDADGSSIAMTRRSPVPQGFQPACEAAIPDGARSAKANGQVLALPKPDPTRIAVIGDTGCRVARDYVQACNDPTQWPLPRVASRVAAAQPGLVIHVGDYYYREVPCPPDQKTLCEGSPSGDRWDSWNADFFAPARDLLQAAPWAFARGNHENCTRGWRGWFYYLDPHPWRGETCEAMQPPYRIQLGAFRLVMFDTAAARDSFGPAEIAPYAAALASIQEEHAWLVSHHPFWGLKTVKGSSQPATPSMTQAWRKSPPRGIDLLVSGHIHLFELLGFNHGLPPQLIAGDGGADLSDAIKEPLRGTRLDNAKVLAGATARKYGYTLLARFAGTWRLTLNDTGDRMLAACDIEHRTVSCH